MTERKPGPGLNPHRALGGKATHLAMLGLGAAALLGSGLLTPVRPSAPVAKKDR